MTPSEWLPLVVPALAGALFTGFAGLILWLNRLGGRVQSLEIAKVAHDKAAEADGKEMHEISQTLQRIEVTIAEFMGGTRADIKTLFKTSEDLRTAHK